MSVKTSQFQRQAKPLLILLAVLLSLFSLLIAVLSFQSLMASWFSLSPWLQNALRLGLLCLQIPIFHWLWRRSRAARHAAENHPD